MLETNRDFYNGYQAGLRSSGVQPTPDAGDIVYDPDGEYDNGTVGKAIQSMDAGDVSYDASESYNSGTVGKAISDVKSHIEELDINTIGLYPQKQITDTAIASFSDGADGVPVKSLTVGIEPVQDLHGYDNPWPAGGGVNILQSAASGTYTDHDITFTCDGNGSYTVKGTASADALYDFTIPEVNFATTDYMHLLNTQATSQVTVNLIYNDGQTATQYYSASTSSVNRIRDMTSATGTKATRIRIYVASGTVVDMKLSPMICHDNTARSYAPYSNICPISGHTSAVVTRTGKNLFSYNNLYNGYWLADGFHGDNSKLDYDTADSTTGLWAYVKVPVVAGGKITISGMQQKAGTYCAFFGDTPSEVISTFLNTSQDGTKTVPAGAKWLGLCIHVGGSDHPKSTNPNAQVEIGETATSFAPFNGQTITIDLDGTRYGGTLDVTNGVLTVTHEFYNLQNILSDRILSYDYNGKHGVYFQYAAGKNGTYLDGLCNMSKVESGASDLNQYMWFGINSSHIYWVGILDALGLADVSAFKTWLGSNEVDIYRPLVTPLTVSLTPASLTTVLGNNNVFADTGDIEELTYRADLSTILPANPSSDGTYILKVTVSSGVATYAWVEEE